MQNNKDFQNMPKSRIVGLIDLQMLSNEVEKPISKKEWDIVRFKDLQNYIIECSYNGQQIEVEILNEYNSLLKNIS